MRVPHTFATFECVGQTNRCNPNLVCRSNQFPLIPKPGMSGAPGTRQNAGATPLRFIGIPNPSQWVFFKSLEQSARLRKIAVIS